MSTRTSTLGFFLTITVMSCWSVSAQGPGGQGQRPPTPAIDTVFDTDGDEIISGAEIHKAKARLATLDADNDHQLSFRECLGFAPRGGDQQPPQGGRTRAGGQPPAPPIFSALDRNSDQIIDRNEMTNAASALQQLDKNLDGELTADEYRPQHPGGPGRGRPGGGGPMSGGQMRGGAVGGGQS